jgi:hypothetical protein
MRNRAHGDDRVYRGLLNTAQIMVGEIFKTASGETPPG